MFKIKTIYKEETKNLNLKKSGKLLITCFMYYFKFLEIFKRFRV